VGSVGDPNRDRRNIALGGTASEYKSRLEVGRNRGAEVDISPRHRMAEAKTMRVEELSLELQVVADAVLRVARHGQIDRRQVNPDLMRAARLQTYVEESMPSHCLPYLEVRYRLARLVRVQRASRRITAVTADRSVDSARPRARPSANECQIPAFDLAPADRFLQCTVRLLGSRDDEEPGRFAIEPVDDAGPLGILPTSSAKRQELSRKRPRASSRTRVHGQPGRLVHDQEVLVLE